MGTTLGDDAMTAAHDEKLLTAEEFGELPDDGKFYELVNGRLVEVPPSFSASSLVAMTLGSIVAMFVRQHRLGICLGEGGGVQTTRRPDSVRAPDFSFISTAHVPPGGVPRRGYLPSPDLAVEVMSESDRFSDLIRKIEEYFAAGTRLAWLIIPRERSALVFHPGQPPLVLTGDAALDGEDLLPGLPLPLSDLWAGLAGDQEP
jgi:Uma2 family endonuclease